MFLESTEEKMMISQPSGREMKITLKIIVQTKVKKNQK